MLKKKRNVKNASAIVIIIQNDMIKPGIKGVLNVLKACARAKEVKRVILTSSAAAVTINQLDGTGLVMDESNWTDVEFLNTAKPPTWVINQTLFRTWDGEWLFTLPFLHGKD